MKMKNKIKEDKSIPTNPHKYAAAKRECNKSYGKKTSAYRSGCYVRKYTSYGGKYKTVKESIETVGVEDKTYGIFPAVMKGDRVFVPTNSNTIEIFEVDFSVDGIEKCVVFIKDDQCFVIDQNLMTEDLKQWFGKGKRGNWLDISRTNKDGSHPECGRDDADKGGYPVCRPKSVASKMSKKEKEKMVRKKRKAERNKGSKDNSRVKFKDKYEVD